LTVVAIFLLPAGYFFLNFLRSRQDTLQENRQISQRIRSLQEKLARQPHDASACTALGDIFFRQRDYEKALALYQKAYQIDPVPWLAQKVKVAHRENEIQKGNLWLCPECGTRNTGKTDYCCSCGQPRNTILSWKSELKQQRRMLLLGLLAVILIPLFLMVLAGIFKGFSLMAVFVFSCLLVYLIFWKLFSW
ncbi:MAG TPA: tetratricopeptide repeat protein, partial [bacterium]|nr:tetratricopeptide repeat protein [bacterium]